MDAFRGNEDLRREIAKIVKNWIVAHDALDIERCLEPCCEDIVCNVRGFGQFDGRHELQRYFELHKQNSMVNTRDIAELEMFFGRGTVTCAGWLVPVGRPVVPNARGVFLAHLRRDEVGWCIDSVSIQGHETSLADDRRERPFSLLAQL